MEGAAGADAGGGAQFDGDALDGGREVDAAAGFADVVGEGEVVGAEGAAGVAEGLFRAEAAFARAEAEADFPVQPGHADVVGVFGELAAQEGAPEGLEGLPADGAFHPGAGGDGFVGAPVGLALEPEAGEAEAEAAGEADGVEAEEVEGGDEGVDAAVHDVAVAGLDPLEAVAEAEVLEVANDGRVVGEDVVVEAFDGFAADLEGDDLAAGFIAAFEDRDLVAEFLEAAGGGESGDAGADDPRSHEATAGRSSAGAGRRRARRAMGMP